MTDPIVYRHRRTLGHGPPTNLYKGEIAYSDVNHTLHVGRPAEGIRDIGGAACFVRQQNPQGQNGGTFTAGAWRTRPLNTLTGNKSFCEILNDGSLQLAPGDYEVFGWATTLAVKSHRTRLIMANSDVLLWGDSAYANSWVESRSFLAGRFSLTSQAAVRLEHRCIKTRTAWGFGYRSNFGPEIYAQLTLNKY
ncbi:MAG: hypothetical protein AAF282_02170 [Cyanobacteria bacterium P01_A01_bin.15]